MINKILSSQVLWIFVLIGLVTSCEHEDNLVGYGVVGDNAANLEVSYLDLVAETLGSDTVRSDKGVGGNITIGAFQDPTFGKTKSSYYSQVRLNTLNPNFGSNASVDSVILSIPVWVEDADDPQTTKELYKTIYTTIQADGVCSIEDTITQYLNRTHIPMDSIYGNRDATMNLQVHRVIENLGTVDSMYFSNREFQTAELFGEKLINDIAIKESLIQYRTKSASDSTVLWEDNNPSIKIKLEGMQSFLQDNMINGNPANLSDQVSFISNILQGIKIGIENEDGFIINIPASSISLVAYISSDNENFKDLNNNGIHDEDENCSASSVLSRNSNRYSFIVGSSTDATSSKFYNVTQNAIENTNGSMILGVEHPETNFLKGMGGAEVLLSLDPMQIDEIRNNVENNGWIINEAHIKVFPDKNMQGDLPLPEFLHIFNYSKMDLIADYGSDGGTEPVSPYNQIAPGYNQDKGYYLLRCTEYIKNIVEKNEPIDQLMLKMGTYTGIDPRSPFYLPYGAYVTDNLYNPYRLAIIGSGSNSDQKLQLEVYYSVKD